MKKAVFLGFLKVIILALIVCSAIFLILTGKYMENRTQKSMLYSVEIIKHNLDYEKELQPQIDKLNPLVYNSSSRITIISKDGRVLADTSSLIDYDDNHGDRKEVIDAVKNGRGYNKRYSNTIGKNLMYVTEFAEEGNCVIRLAIPYNGLMDFSKAIIPAVVLSIIAAFIAAFLFAKRLAATITGPLDEISTELLKIQNDGQIISFKRYKYDELNSIVRSTETLSDRIEKQVELLKDENKKMDNILCNMREGLILINENMEVVVINKAALNILNCSDNSAGRNIICYTRNLKITEGSAKILKNGGESYCDIESEGTVYMVHITRVDSGVIILFMDVTYERQSDIIRQNFFSDASHELKTPITSINGYAELLTGDIKYSDEKQKEFLNRIKNEAKNMTGLINDILMISRMEASNNIPDRNEMGYVSIYDIIDDIIKTIEPVRNDIKINLNCEKVSIRAEYNSMYQLINNLIINAVKYNKPDGSIYITLFSENGNLVFNIKDTGIGIPVEYQKRVFERFFRVDKGRSRKMGGTGLGLAIVKHIVNLYNGSIILDSEVNVGTEITVTIPLE